MIEKDATAVDSNGLVVYYGEVTDQGRRIADGQAASKVSRDVVGKELVGDATGVVVTADHVQSRSVDAIIVLKTAAVNPDHAAVDAQSTADGALTIVITEIGLGDVNLAFQEAQATAIHEINGIYSAVIQIVVYIAIVYHHFRVFGVQGATVFAREIAKESAVADFHILAVEDTHGATILVAVQSRLAVLEAAVVEPATARILHSDAVPSATTRVEDREPCCVGNGEADGVVSCAEGIQHGIVPDHDVEKSVKQHRGSRHDAQRVLNDDIVGYQDGVGFPTARLRPRHFDGLRFGEEAAKHESQ